MAIQHVVTKTRIISLVFDGLSLTQCPILELPYTKCKPMKPNRKCILLLLPYVSTLERQTFEKTKIHFKIIE